MSPAPPSRRVVPDAALVSRLIAAQFPQWAHLAVRPVSFGGRNNTTFHLGEAMSVRLPAAKAYVAQVEKEQRWLPFLAPQLPLPIPTPLGLGVPGEGFPAPWSVYGWIAGETAEPERITDLGEFAIDLANFLNILQAIDATDGPLAGQHNFFRGGALSTYDAQTRDAITALAGSLDGKLATEIWETALATDWKHAPVWLHGDVAIGNLLVQDGRLSAVIDFGILGVGDPASDLSICWTLLDAPSRAAFRRFRPLDPGTYARGRAWTLWKALITCAGDEPEVEKLKSRRVLDEVMRDHKTT